MLRPLGKMSDTNRRFDDVPCDYAALAVEGVQGLTPYKPGKPIDELERELGVTDTLKLASNENPLGPSPMALEAIARHMDDLALYPDGSGLALKSALADRLGVGVEQITLGNGSNEVLELIARAYLGPGREAVFSEHAFAVYPLVTQAAGAAARVAAANPPGHAQPYGSDLEAMLTAINERTRVVFLANPNNPTGTWLECKALEGFLQSVPPSVLVVVDEAYVEYAQVPDYSDALGWLKDHPNLLVTRTFSKAYGLAALRIGFGVSHPDVAEILNRVRQPFNTNTLAQVAAVAALGDLDHIQRSVRMNTEGLRQLGAAFDQRGLPYIPSAANFLTVEVGGDAQAVYEGLLRHAVIVRPVANYGLPRHLRITVGREADNLRVMAALDAVMSR